MAHPERVEVKLPVSFIKEGDHVVAYTPALDISTAGKDELEAKQRFSELVRIFFNDLIESQTVDSVLSELGWRKTAEHWQPPIVSQQSLNVEVPAFA